MPLTPPMSCAFDATHVTNQSRTPRTSHIAAGAVRRMPAVPSSKHPSSPCHSSLPHTRIGRAPHTAHHRPVQRSQDSVHALDGAAPAVYLDQAGSLHLHHDQLPAHSGSGPQPRPAAAPDATPKAASAGRTADAAQPAPRSRAARGAGDVSGGEGSVSGAGAAQRLGSTPVEQQQQRATATAAATASEQHSDDHREDEAAASSSSLQHSVLAALRGISKVSV